MKKRNKLIYFTAIVLSAAMITSCSAAITTPSANLAKNKLQATTIESTPAEQTGTIGADIEIGNISGFFGISADIQNVGNETANVNWSITVTTITGFILTGSKTQGEDLNIPAGQAETVKSGIILGFGNVEVEVSAEIPGDSADKTASAFIFIIFVLNVS